MFLGRLRSRDYDPGGAKRAPRRTTWRQAVSRVLDVAFVSDNVGVDSERNGTPSTVAGAPGSFWAPTGSSEGAPPSDPAPADAFRRDPTGQRGSGNCSPAGFGHGSGGEGRSRPRSRDEDGTDQHPPVQ